MRKVRQKAELAAAGGYLKGHRNSTRVIKWDLDGRNVRPGPGIIAIISIKCIMSIMYIIALFTKTGVLYYESQRIKPVPTYFSTRSG
jgi:hypothetical protein